jgi:predicted tellurium resistance membrane protein TerC
LDWLVNPEIWIALFTLTALEIVLGIDNIIFISILTDKLPENRQALARRVGLGLAMLMRILLLFSITWVIRLTEPLFTVFSQEISGRDLILIGGGLFLLGKATYEIHDKLEGEDHHAPGGGKAGATMAGVIAQIMLIDIVFSLDSVITAVGMTPHVPIMMVAVVLAAVVMLVFAGPIANFVAKHPTMKMLALAFLILIGVMLVAEAFGQHVDKGYIYFAMAFSLLVELLNMRLRKKAPPVELRHSSLPQES